MLTDELLDIAVEFFLLVLLVRVGLMIVGFGGSVREGDVVRIYLEGVVSRKRLFVNECM